MLFPTTLLLAALTSLVSSAALPAQLETRQAATVVRFYTEKDFAGQWADMGVEEINVCRTSSSSSSLSCNVDRAINRKPPNLRKGQR